MSEVTEALGRVEELQQQLIASMAEQSRLDALDRQQIARLLIVMTRISEALIEMAGADAVVATNLAEAISRADNTVGSPGEASDAALKSGGQDE